VKELIECIKNNTTNNSKEIEKCITSMICSSNELVPLNEKSLLDALNIKGEFLALKLHYDDLEDELQNEVIKRKMSQSLSVIISYEDDTNSYEKIANFVEYIHDISDENQNSTFGVKKVYELSTYPITILFSGILPINQLNMTIGKKLYDFIDTDKLYFKNKFKKYRDEVSKIIGVPLLPILPMLDEDLSDFRVKLVDIFDGRVISEFDVCSKITKDTIDIYLQKLVYVYTVLAEEKEC
jgi:hypothetical protein